MELFARCRLRAIAVIQLHNIVLSVFDLPVCLHQIVRKKTQVSPPLKQQQRAAAMAATTANGRVHQRGPREAVTADIGRVGR
jgi:hypothetical protein